MARQGFFYRSHLLSHVLDKLYIMSRKRYNEAYYEEYDELDYEEETVDDGLSRGSDSDNDGSSYSGDDRSPPVISTTPSLFSAIHKDWVSSAYWLKTDPSVHKSRSAIRHMNKRGLNLDP